MKRQCQRLHSGFEIVEKCVFKGVLCMRIMLEKALCAIRLTNLACPRYTSFLVLLLLLQKAVSSMTCCSTMPACCHVD